jgi:hypothetical protein
MSAPSLKLANLTVFAELENNLNLRNVFNLLPCVTVPNYSFNGSSKIPYFGLEGIIIGMKSADYGCIGIRSSKNTGAMKNCISVDVQITFKNVNVKIYSRLFHIVGLTSEKNGQEITDFLINVLGELEEAWRPFLSLEPKERMNFIETYVRPIAYNDGELMSTTDEEFMNRYEATTTTNPALRLLLSFIDSYPTKELYEKKLDWIVNTVVNSASVFTESGPVRFTGFRRPSGIYDGVFTYGYLVLQDVLVQLLERGIRASFSNERSKEILIKTYTVEDDEVLEHQISLKHDCKIKVLSPGSQETVWEEVQRINEIIGVIVRESLGFENRDVISLARLKERLTNTLETPVTSPSTDGSESDF